MMDRLTDMFSRFWGMKFRLMLIALIILGIHAYYKQYDNLFLAIMNGAGLLGVSVIGALAWLEKDEK